MKKERAFFNWGYVEYDVFAEVITCYNWLGFKLGYIMADKGKWKLVLEGHDPIAEGWEDSTGNTISLDGWIALEKMFE